MGIGILAGALQGGAQAAGQVADETIKQNNTLALQKAQSDLALERESQIARLQSNLRLSEDAALNDQNSANGQNRLAMREKTNAQDVARDTAAAKGRLAAEADQTSANGANPAYLKGVKATAEAKETDSEKSVRAAQVRASNAQTDIAKLDVEDKRMFRKLSDEFTGMPPVEQQTPQQKERTVQIQRQLEVLRNRTGQAKDPEYDTVETNTEKIGDDGTKTVTKTTSKRRPGAAPAAAAQDSGAVLRANLEAIRKGGGAAAPAPAAPPVFDPNSREDQALQTGLAPSTAAFKQADAAYKQALQTRDSGQIQAALQKRNEAYAALNSYASSVFKDEQRRKRFLLEATQ